MLKWVQIQPAQYALAIAGSQAEVEFQEEHIDGQMALISIARFISPDRTCFTADVVAVRSESFCKKPTFWRCTEGFVDSREADSVTWRDRQPLL